MRQLYLLKIIFLIVIASCNSKSDQNIKYSYKDSILKEHILKLDSLPYFDTTDINFRVLKAYQINDTSFFKKLHSGIERDRKYKPQWEFEDSCIHQQKLQDLNVDEAYRFIFTAAFCPYKINTTLTKKINSINLHFIIYQYNRDTAACRVLNEYDKKLTSENWTDITEALERADIWGLKRENANRGLDGSTITFIGYKKGDSSYRRSDKLNYVYRWEATTLRESLNLILKMSGNKQGCFWIR